LDHHQGGLYLISEATAYAVASLIRYNPP